MSDKIMLLLIVLGTIIGCKKVELPAEMMSGPIFSFAALINGSVRSNSAGADNYYLFTDNYIDEFGTPVYYGQLANLSDCPGECLESLTIEFRNTTEAMNLDQNLLSPGQRDYYAGLIDTSVIDLLSLTFENISFTNDPNVEYLWDFGNGLTSNLENPGTIIFDNADHAGINSVISLTVTNSAGCSISTAVDIASGDPVSQNCPVQFGWQNNAPAGLEICAFDLVNTPLDIFWTFGDTTINSNCFELPQNDNAFISASVTSLTGCEDPVIIVSQVDTLTGLVSVCHAGFYISNIESIGTMIDQAGLGTVNIKYTDVNGVTFESGYVANQNGYSFEILSSEDYVLNENGKNTRQFEFKFTGKLANSTGAEIEIQNATGNWAIAIE